jgi:hypothetical protein
VVGAGVAELLAQVGHLPDDRRRPDRRVAGPQHLGRADQVLEAVGVRRSGVVAPPRGLDGPQVGPVAGQVALGRPGEQRLIGDRQAGVRDVDPRTAGQPGHQRDAAEDGGYHQHRQAGRGEPGPAPAPGAAVPDAFDQRGRRQHVRGVAAQRRAQRVFQVGTHRVPPAADRW